MMIHRKGAKDAKEITRHYSETPVIPVHTGIQATTAPSIATLFSTTHDCRTLFVPVIIPGFRHAPE